MKGRDARGGVAATLEAAGTPAARSANPDVDESKLSSAHQKSEISGDDVSTATASEASGEERSESRESSASRAFYTDAAPS